MKRFLLMMLMITVLLLGASAFAQTGTMITVKFTPSPTPTVVGHDIYGASGMCPATGLPASATVLGTVAAPGSSYDFKLGTPGIVYCFYSKAKDSAGNTSVASNTAQATFPYPPILPDTDVVAVPK